MKDEIKEEIRKTEEMSEVADDRLDEVNGGAVRFSEAPKGSIVSNGKASNQEEFHYDIIHLHQYQLYA